METTDKFFNVLLIISAVALALAIFFGVLEISEYRKELPKSGAPAAPVEAAPAAPPAAPSATAPAAS